MAISQVHSPTFFLSPFLLSLSSSLSELLSLFFPLETLPSARDKQEERALSFSCTWSVGLPGSREQFTYLVACHQCRRLGMCTLSFQRAIIINTHKFMKSDGNGERTKHRDWQAEKQETVFIDVYTLPMSSGGGWGRERTREDKMASLLERGLLWRARE